MSFTLIHSGRTLVLYAWDGGSCYYQDAWGEWRSQSQNPSARCLTKSVIERVGFVPLRSEWVSE